MNPSVMRDLRQGMNELRRLYVSSSFLQLRGFTAAAQSAKDYSDEYTHIIVGAGSAGCVLANRLSAQPNNKVLLLEAGPEDKSWKIQMPGALFILRPIKGYNWYYHTVPQSHLDNREIYWPRGKVLGGSSSINSMIYVRGHPEDYDRWEREGATGWSYADCLPYFKRAQCHELGEDEYRGGYGPLHVSRGKSKNPVFDAFIEAGVKCGYPYTSDINGYQQEGFGYLDMTVHKGVRSTTADAYLRSGNVLHRDNLTLLSGSFASKVVFEGNKAVGIEFTQKDVRKIARATQDVILSGGAINSPQLLMLSGLGNADELKELGVPVVAHLPGVGQNLQDHLEVPVVYRSPKPALFGSKWKYPFHMAAIGLEWFLFKTGLGATNNIEAGAFMRSQPGVIQPDIQFLLVAPLNQAHGFEIHLNTLRETSRGFIKLKSCNPKEHPLINPNYLETDTDRRDLRESIKLARKIAAQEPLHQFGREEVEPGWSVKTDLEIDSYVRAKVETNYHPCCTCKMGSQDDPRAVVDSSTRVLGVENLRVVDASIMPSNISGNLNAPTIMIAEKAADMILGNKPLDQVEVPVWRPVSL